jgi:hypothetical protein
VPKSLRVEALNKSLLSRLGCYTRTAWKAVKKGLAPASAQL